MYDPAQQQGQGYNSLANQQEPTLLLNRYRVVERRGTGGFASVMVCLDTRLGRKVAIKCMPLTQTAGMATSTLNEALEEARITSNLSHPNIVTVHDFEVRDNIAYLIMEFVDGLTLTELMSRVEGGALTYDECAHLLNSLAGALDHAHANGVLHLDIKPSNVFIDINGTIKLGDFGMASLASAAGWEGARGGTVGYMPPEQLQGYTVDERTDVFALAVVCYQALTGASPFAAKDAEASLKRILKGAQPLAKIEPELKGPVSDCIGRALNSEPGARQDSAGELCRAVLPYLGDELDGQQSVASLMAQAKGETGPSEDEWGEADHITLVEQHPWLPNAAARVTSAATFGTIAARFMPAILQSMGIETDPVTAALASFGVLAVLGAFLPEAAGLLSATICVVALLATGAYSPIFLVAVLLIALILSWRYATQGAHKLSYAALLVPTAIGSPLGGFALAGFVLTPLYAALTAALASAIALVMGQVSAGDGSAVANACATLFSHPTAWLTILSCSLSACIASLFMHRIKVGTRIFGQILACALAVAFQMIATRVENGGIWGTPDIFDVLVALTCLVLMSIAIWAYGPELMPQGDE